MDITENIFHRLFSVNMYKTHKLPLGVLSLSKDFVTSERGDLYPALHNKENVKEYIEKNIFIVKEGRAERVMGQFFPYATYELSFNINSGKAGFVFNISSGKAAILYDNSEITFDDGIYRQSFKQEGLTKLIVTCSPGSFGIYSYCNNNAYYLCTFKSKTFEKSDYYDEFKSGFAAFVAEGCVEISDGSFYLDSGVSQADIRPVTYEDGTAVTEQGKIFFTASIRIHEGSFQGVFSWVPGTADFELVGAIFYDAGDSRWCNDVAATVVFNRFTDEWNLWVCSFAHDHVLGHASFKGDPRFGINVIDIELMDKRAKGDGTGVFLGKEGDEDPALIFDKENNRWLMAICRLDDETKKYRYVFFESDNPFDNFKYIGKGYEGEETGGSFVNIEGEIHFICGNNFSKKSDYRVYNKNGMKNARFDFCDGGFRGWGTVIPILKGSRKKYYWLTFDRHNGSSYNWSYGNMYCFELTV